MNSESNAFIPNAIYRFTRTEDLQYYRAAVTKIGTEFLYPISIDGSRVASTATDGRSYVLLYFMTKWKKLAAAGYWLNPRKAFDAAYVTDATAEDLDIVAHNLAELITVDAQLDVLNRDEIELDMEIWGDLLMKE